MPGEKILSFGRRKFPAMGHRDFRLFWTGQCVSLVGTWMQNIGQSWLVLKLTGSPMKLGLVSAVQFLPVLFLSIFAGPFVDRFSKKKMLLFTQSILMLLAFSLALLTATGLVRYWQVLVLALLLGLTNTLDVPTRQAFLIELVGRKDLMNAISLNATMFNLARIVGPAVAGLMIGALGIAPCFTLNGISFIAVIVALTRIDNAGPAARPDGPDSADPLGRAPGKAARRFELSILLRETGEGIAYIAGQSGILWPLALLGAMSLFVLNFSVVMPIFARDALQGGAFEYGFLMTSMGLGSLCGALTLAFRSGSGPRIKRILAGAFGMSAFSVLVGFQHNFYASCALMALTGFCTIQCTTQSNTLIQMRSEDGMRGRVMSVMNLVFGGVTPIGSLYAGALIEAAGASLCLAASGGIGILAAGATSLAVFRSAAKPGAKK